MSLLVLGSVAFDEIITPFDESGKIVGGSATHFAYAASKFVAVNIVSIVGNDFPKTEIEAFNKNRIDTKGLEIAQNQKTFFWKGKYHMDMNSRDTLVTELNAFEHYEANLPEEYRDADFVMLANIAPANQIKVLSQLKKKPKLVVLDTMNLWIDIAKQDLEKVMKQVDIILMNDSEARQFTGQYSLVAAAKEMMKLGPKSVIIKKGEHGALFFHDSNVFAIPGMPLEEVFDPTGAGDSFAGGFMGYIVQTRNISFENLKRAIVVGSATASLCVEKFGVEKLKSCSYEDVKARVQNFVNLATFEIELI